MADSRKAAARRAVREAQAKYDRDRAASEDTRREAFEKARKDGLTLREIGEEIDLHRTRVGQIINGE